MSDKNEKMQIDWNTAAYASAVIGNWDILTGDIVIMMDKDALSYIESKIESIQAGIQRSYEDQYYTYESDIDEDAECAYNLTEFEKIILGIKIVKKEDYYNEEEYRYRLEEG